MTTAKLRNSTGNSLRISGGKIVTRYILFRVSLFRVADFGTARARASMMIRQMLVFMV